MCFFQKLKNFFAKILHWYKEPSADNERNHLINSKSDYLIISAPSDAVTFSFPSSRKAEKQDDLPMNSSVSPRGKDDAERALPVPSPVSTLKNAEEEKKQQEERQLKVASALNLFMVSISQIVDYNNETVLRQEYDAILNNLNLEEMILDKEMLDLVLKTMDVCHFFVLHAKDKEMLKKKQQLRLKNCLANALGGGNIFAVISTPNPWAIAAGVAAMVGVAAVNYKSQRNKAELENEIEEWELEKSALEQLHNLRRSMFEAAWKLEEKYNYPDKYRLTEKQVGYYNKVLAIPDPVERYNKLNLLGKYFEAYPIFWYYLGRAAMESATLYCDFENIYNDQNNKQKFANYIDGYRYNCPEMYKYFIKKAETAFENFGKIHHHSMFLREDLIAATAYLDYAHILQLEKANAEEIKEQVDNAKKFAGLSEDILQRCAFDYLSLAASSDVKINEDCIDAAIECLRLLISQDCNVEMNSLALSRIYRGDFDGIPRRLDYVFLRDEARRNCEFIRARIAPFQLESENDREIQDYVEGKGLQRTLYRFFYGFFMLYLREYFEVLDEVEQGGSYESLKNFKSIFSQLKDSETMEDAFKEMFAGEIFVDLQKEFSNNLEILRTRLWKKIDEDIKASQEWRTFYFGHRLTTYDSGRFALMKKSFEETFKDTMVKFAKKVADNIKSSNKYKNDCQKAMVEFTAYDTAGYQMRLDIRKSIVSCAHFNYLIPEEFRDNPEEEHAGVKLLGNELKAEDFKAKPKVGECQEA